MNGTQRMPSELLSLIHHEVEHAFIQQRALDGYIHATAMCRAVGRFFGNYRQMNQTQAFLEEVSTVIGIPISGLVQVIQVC